jgi:hypothetical protein
MWQPMPGPCGGTKFVHQHATCQLSKSYDMSPATCEAVPYHVSMYGLYDCTVSNFFPYLENQTERDISLIRCLFEPVRSALGLY